MSNKLLSLLCVAAIISLPIFANETKTSSHIEKISQQDIKYINELSDAKALKKLSASDTIDDWADSALNNFGLDEFGEHDGKFFIFAQQSVMLKPTDPQFGDAVVNAYDKAMIKLQEKYVMLRFGKTTVDKVQSFYNDSSTNAKEIELPKAEDPGFLSKVMLVLDKQLDVIGAKLDEELIDMGADRDSINKMTPTMKKDLFRNKFVKNTIRSAQGSIAGLIPIQTSMARDDKGSYSIGVIAVASSKTQQIAKDIAYQRKSIVSGKGREISTLLPHSPKEYLGTFGTRLAYDLDGSPVILSYGIASYVPNAGDDYINDELKSDARSTAIANADSQIAELINGRMNVKEQRKSGEEVRKYVEREVIANSDTIEKTIKNIIKTTDKLTKSTAQAKLQGISSVKKWRYKTAEGHNYVGVVRVWKYSTLEAVNNFGKSNRGTGTSKTKERSYNSSIQSSAPINDVNDF